MKIYPVISVSTKPSLVHVVETLNQEYSFSATKSRPWFFLTRHKGYVKSSRSSWSRFSLRSFSMKDGGLHVPRTKPSSPLHTKPKGLMTCRRATKAPRGRHNKIQAWAGLKHSTQCTQPVDARWSHTKPRSPVSQARTALDLNQGVLVNLTCKLTKKQQTVKFKSVSAGFPNHSYAGYR